MIAQAMAKMRSVKQSEANGCAASFVKVTDEWGLKFFKYEDTRDAAVDRQTRVYHIGYAPKVGDTCEFEWHGNTFYGYMTEICPNICEDVEAENLGLSTEEFWREAGRWGNVEHIQESDEYLEMQEAMCEINEWDGDDHAANFGWMDDGRIVYIDFS